MRTLLALVIPLVFAKLDLSHVRAPGMYPPEETRTDVPDIPLNSYQMTMTDISGDFNNYQYYYEKDPTPASKDSNGHGSVNKGPIPPQTSEVRQQINVSTSYANIQGGPPTVDDTSPLQYVSPPSRPSTENKKTDEAVEWTPQQNRPASPSDVGDVYRDRPQYSNFDEKIAIKVPVKTDSYKQDDIHDSYVQSKQENKLSEKKQYGSVKNIISNQQKRIHSSNDFERRQSFDRTTNSYDERPHTGNTRTQMNSEWTNSRIATNDGYVGKKTKPCCPCCRTSAASSAPVGTKETSSLPQGQQTQESASSLDDYDYEKGAAGKQPKAEKYTEIYGGGSKVIEKNEKYNTLPSNAARLPNKIYPSSGSSTWEDLTPHNNDNSYIHQVGSLPLPGADQLYHGRVVMHNHYQIPNPPTSYAPLPQPFNYGSSGCSCGGAAAPAPSCCASGCSCSGPAPPACCTSGCSCSAAPVPSCCTPVQPCCIPSTPCCPPPVQCCPQQPICCQPLPPCCPPPPVCCPAPALPPCFRACPTCPCRRRAHQTLRMKRSPKGGRCFKCTVGGEAKIVRPKRQAANCRDCTNNSIKSLIAQPSSTCSACIRSDMRAVRVKRMGCMPCNKRRKRDVDPDHHQRVKRTFQGCSQCSGRKKRSFNDCAQCSNLGQVLRRFKRSFGCSLCGRKKRQVDSNIYTTFEAEETCDKTCCDYSKCPHLNAKKMAAFRQFLLSI